MSNSDNTSSSSKKKKVAAAAVAVALAAALMIGGTFSYLSDSSVAVVNEFDGNKVYVELSETGATAETDDNGDETGTYINDSFTIIPGSSETKDPEVTVTTTVDAYVYLIVTDNTQGLVDYTIDESIWTLIDDLTTEDDDVTTYVYYTTVDPDNNDDDGEQSFYALVSNTVYYSSSLTNDDLEDADDVTLSFQSYAIQTEGFSSALAAYYAAVNEVPTATVTVDSNPSEVSIAQLESPTVKVGTITPDITFTFESEDTSSTVSSSAYADWYVDFYVTFDVSGVTDTTALSSWNGYVAIAGQYDYFSSDYWFPLVLKAYSYGDNETYSFNLCRGVLGTGKYLTYTTLVSYVGEFNCGTVKTVSSDNASTAVVTLADTVGGIDVPDGVVMTVELRLYKDVVGNTEYDDTYITVATYKYTY